MGYGVYAREVAFEASEGLCRRDVPVEDEFVTASGGKGAVVRRDTEGENFVAV